MGTFINAAGQAVHHFKWGEKNVDGYITDNTPNSGSKLSWHDPYADINKCIETVGHTPLTGPGVCHTSDGKIFYQIRPNLIAGGYITAIISQGNTLGEIQTPTIKDAIVNMEEKSNLPGISGNPMTREEAQFRATHSEKEYKAKYGQ